jgi:hypothetical protein
VSANDAVRRIQENQQQAINRSDELLKLRAQVDSLLRQNMVLTDLAAFATNSMDEIPVNEADYFIPDGWADAGQSSATAAVRTALWPRRKTTLKNSSRCLGFPMISKSFTLTD